MARARIKFLTPKAKILAQVAKPRGQEIFLPEGSRILFLPSPLVENPIFWRYSFVKMKNFFYERIILTKFFHYDGFTSNYPFCRLSSKNTAFNSYIVNHMITIKICLALYVPILF